MKAVSQKASLHDSLFTLTTQILLVAIVFISALPLHLQAADAAAVVESMEAVVDNADNEEEAEVEPEAAVPATAKKAVIEKSPVISSMATRIIDKTLVQDLVRVGERIFLAGVRGHIGWSDDNGVTWQQAKVPTIQDINAIYFVTQELGWAVGHDGNIFHTTDGGKTWIMQLDGLAFNLLRAQAKADKLSGDLASKQDELAKTEAELEAAQAAGKKKTEKLEVAIEELQEVIDELDFRVRDARQTLEIENAPWPLMDVWFSDINNGFVVGAFNAFLMTTDGGQSWHDVSNRLENPDDQHLNTVAGNGATLLIGGEAGMLFRSRDAGATWETLESPDDGSFYSLQITRVQPDAVSVWTVGMEGSVFRSTDSGNTWERIEHDISNNLNGIWVDEQGLVLMAGNDGALLRSTDGGKTFEGHNRVDQVTLSSVVVAANGDYVFGGAAGIIRAKAAEWNVKE